MAVRVRRPEVVKLEISQGDWLLVKKHLTAGERRALFGRMMGAGDRSDQLDRTRVGLAKILTYLIDWSFDDADGKRIVILDQPIEVVEAALDAIDSESFTEVLKAIEEHEDSMEKARAVEKNDKAGESASLAISPSAA